MAGFELLFINATTVTLYRHLHVLRHGSWIRHPPELIKSGKHFLCIIDSKRAFGGVTGKLQYAVLLNGIEYIVSASFELPILSDNRFQVVMGTNMEALKRTGHPPAALFVLKHRTEGSAPERFVVELSETREGAKHMEYLRREVAKKKDSHNLSFVWNVKNIDWLRRLRRAHRSVRIRIVNLTRGTLNLCLNAKQTIPALEDGVWVEFPAREIPSYCAAEFGCQSESIFVGTAGQCSYAIAGEPGVFTFSWTQPGMGWLKASGKHSTAKFTVYKHVESLNEASIHYHIMDPKTPPNLHLVSAKAVPQHFFPLPKYDLEGFDVTEKLISYVTSPGCEPSADLSELNLVSPRAFYCSIQDVGTASRSIISSNSALHLNWTIGCESFSMRWGADARVSLQAALVGGIGDTEVILKASLLPRHNFSPSYLFDSSPSDSSKKPKNNDSLEIDHDRLIDLVVEAFSIFSTAMQTIVCSTVETRCGTDWIAQSGLPAGHLWRDRRDVNVDFEGILHIIIIFWNESFEPMIKDLELLHELQTVALHWANQNLQSFNLPFVQRFIETALKVLQASGAKVEPMAELGERLGLNNVSFPCSTELL